MSKRMALTLEESFERCCRLCAEEQEVTLMIFSSEAEAMLLKSKLNKYLLIEVDEDDKLPKHICIQCCTKLNTVCEFIDAVHTAQGVLMNRSIFLEQLSSRNCIKRANVKTEVKSEPEEYSEDETQITEMEVNVDPMHVLQNSDCTFSPNDDNIQNCIEDVTYLHGIDGENVTIKLIKRDDMQSDFDDDKIEEPLTPLTSECSEDKKDCHFKPFPCEICHRGFFTELALKNHCWTHFNDEKVKQFKCSICSLAYDLKNELIAHLKTHKTSGLCQLCGRIFRTEKNLVAHMAVHLSESNSHTCKVCGRSYNTKSNLKIHSITHSNERPFTCHICKKSFKRNQDLKFHLNQHTGARPYKCPFCDKSFASSGNCYSHRNRMHPGRRVDGKVRRRITVSRENQLRPIAPRPAPVIKSPLTNVKGIFKYQCQLCEHSFMKRDNFTYHMYQHTGEKPFQCSFCPEKFVTRRGVMLHHDKEHPTKDRPLALLTKNVLLQ